MAQATGVMVNNTFDVNFTMGVDKDLSTATTLEFHFTDPKGDPLVKTATLGVGDLLDPDDNSVVLFAEGFWAEYLIQTGDFILNGTWSARLKNIGGALGESFSRTIKFTIESI